MSFLIQRSPDQCLFAAPRSLSQLITSLYISTRTGFISFSFYQQRTSHRSSKVRTLLTMLGIIIGVAAVIVIVGLGNGLEGYVDTPILKFSVTYLSMNPGEFPHSEISGSMLICSSPKLIAAYHVFHRLPVPRHSPCALVRLTFQTFFQNIWYPLDSLFCQRRLLLPFLLKLQYFLKELTIIFVSQLLFSFQGTSW